MKFKRYSDFIEYFELLWAFSEFEICSNDITIDNMEDGESDFFFFEQLAFWFLYVRDEEKIYHSMYTYKKKDWSMYGSPDRSLVTANCLKYRYKRSQSTQSNFMKFHYLTLLIDFVKDVFSKEDEIREFWDNLMYRLANEIIDTGSFLIKNQQYKHKVIGINYIEILLRISNSFNQKRFHEVETLCIEFESEIAEDDSPWLRWFSLRYLLLSDTYAKKSQITQEQETWLIEDMSERLNRLKAKWGVYWSERCIEDLIEYYNKKGLHDNVIKLIKILEEVYSNKKLDNVSPMIRITYLQNLKKYYLEYDKDNINKIEDINLKITNLWKEVVESMQTLQSKITISDDELDCIISGYYNKAEKKLQEYSFAIRMIPNKVQSEETLKDLIQEHPLLYLGKKSIFDKNWNCIAILDGIKEENNEKEFNLHLISQYHTDITTTWIRLNMVCDLIKKNNREINFLKRWLLKELNSEDFLDKLWGFYINWNNLEFCCIAIPLIESTFREMLGKMWWCVVKPLRDTWTFEYKNLKDVLDDRILQENLPKEYKDFIYYCRVLFIEKHGLNLRNTLSHWIDLQLYESDDIANKVFHVLFCLSILSF